MFGRDREVADLCDVTVFQQTPKLYPRHINRIYIRNAKYSQCAAELNHRSSCFLFGDGCGEIPN